MAKIIGVDIGYGVTKAVESTGKVSIFRSIVGVGVPDTMGLPVSKNKIRTVSLNGSSYTIGEDAERFKMPIVSVRQRNSIESMAYKALLKAAFNDLAENAADKTGPVKVVTGLPVSYMNDADKLQKTIMDVLPGAEVTVVPQPAGTLFDLIFDMNGSYINTGLSSKKIGIVDIGTYTTDILLFENLGLVKAMSGTVTIGINTLTTQIINECIMSGLRRSMTHIEAENALKSGVIRKNGTEINVRDMVNKHRSAISKEIWSYINSIWGAEDQIDEIYLSGGGSPIFKESFIRPNIAAVDNTHLANATGFCKWGVKLYGHQN